MFTLTTALIAYFLLIGFIEGILFIRRAAIRAIVSRRIAE